VWMGNIPVATLRPNGSGISIYYVHANQLGAPVMVTRPADNAIMWRWDSDPFGTVVPNQNPQSLGTFVYNLRFPGQYYQAETGLNYNYHRDYDAAVGRYRQSDPIGLRGSSFSTYAYVRGNPISLKDPLGLCPSCDAKSLTELLDQIAPYFQMATTAIDASPLPSTVKNIVNAANDDVIQPASNAQAIVNVLSGNSEQQASGFANLAETAVLAVTEGLEAPLAFFDLAIRAEANQVATVIQQTANSIVYGIMDQAQECQGQGCP